MKERVTITLDTATLERVDSLIDKKKILSRSHAVEMLVQRSLGNSTPKTAILLLGGKGTRFRPITYELPKALIPIQGKTVPEHLIDLFRKYGVVNLIFSVGHMADKIRAHYGDGSKYGVSISYVEEVEPLGSAGAIKLAKHLLSEPFIVTNGDELKDIDLEDMFDFHKRNNAVVTAALTYVNDPSAYGVARYKGNKILEFVEKPSIESAPSNLINSGLSIWDPSVIDMIPVGFSMYEKDVFPILARDEKLFGYVFDGQWFDTGTPERYELALKEWKGI